MTRAANEYERADRERDYRKHDSPSRSTMPPLPDRLDKPLTTAMEVAIQVKALTDYPAAERLIEQYAQTFAAAIPLDRRFALAKMVGYCEGVIKSGILGEEELGLRSIVADVLSAFNMPSKAECDATVARSAS